MVKTMGEVRASGALRQLLKVFALKVKLLSADPLDPLLHSLTHVHTIVIIENVLFQAATRVSYYQRQRFTVAMVAAGPGLSVWPPIGPRPPSPTTQPFFYTFPLDFLTASLKRKAKSKAKYCISPIFTALCGYEGHASC